MKTPTNFKLLSYFSQPLKFIAIILLLTSCSVDPIDSIQENAEQIHILDNDTFMYSDLRDPDGSSIIIKNGSHFSYSLHTGNVTIISERTPKRVRYYTGMMDRNPQDLEITGNSFSKEGVSENNVFKIYY